MTRVWDRPFLFRQLATFEIDLEACPFAKSTLHARPPTAKSDLPHRQWRSRFTSPSSLPPRLTQHVLLTRSTSNTRTLASSPTWPIPRTGHRRETRTMSSCGSDLMPTNRVSLPSIAVASSRSFDSSPCSSSTDGLPYVKGETLVKNCTPDAVRIV